MLSTGYLASGSEDKSLRIWDFNNNVSIYTIPSAHTLKIECIKDYGTYFLSSADDSLIKMWSSTSYSLIRTFSGHNGNVNILQVLSNGLIASGSSDNSVKVWNQTGSNILSFSPFSNSILCLKELSPGIIAVAGCHQSVFIYYTNGTLIYTITGAVLSQCNAMTLYNQKILAISQNSGTLVLYDITLVKAPVSLPSINGAYYTIYGLESLRRLFINFLY